MSNLQQKINKDLKQAMQDKKTETVSVLRMLAAAIKNKEISLRKGEEIKLSDEQIVEVVNSEAKKRKDSVEAYEQGGRQELADKEKAEIEILSKYLPEQLSDEELKKIVNDVIGSMGEVTAGDFGKIMGQVMSRTKGKAEGNRVNELVRKILAE